MSNYKALLEQKAALDAQIADALKIEKGTAVAQVRNLAAQYGLTAEDVFPAASTKGAGNAGAPKYRDPATGVTWTGRGKPPNWILGKDREQFLIQAEN